MNCLNGTDHVWEPATLQYTPPVRRRCERCGAEDEAQSFGPWIRQHPSFGPWIRQYPFSRDYGPRYSFSANGVPNLDAPTYYERW